MAREARELSDLLGPTHWPTWAAVGQMRLLSMLPQAARMRVGNALGKAIEAGAQDRRNTVDVNLKVCFPEKSDAERKALRHAHFESVGKAILETATCWYAKDKNLPPFVMEGREHLDNALAAGKGVLLVSAHFTPLEMGGRLLCGEVKFDAVYRQHENPAFEYIMAGNRNRHAENAIPRGDIRAMVRALRQNHAVWFAADQAPKFKRLTELVPFFGEPAKTVVATSRIAKMSGAPLVPFFTLRSADDSHYRLIFKPPLENFPSDDPIADTLAINKVIEAQILEAPEQYLWVHKRFKKRGKAYPDLYA